MSEFREEPTIIVTGFWPPTNEMIRHFSQDINLNPSGWLGDNWENRGYDIISYFPTFNDPDCSNFDWIQKYQSCNSGENTFNTY